MTFLKRVGDYFHYMTHLAFLLWIISCFLPKTFLYGVFIPDVYWITILTLIVLPVVGIISLLLAIIFRKLYVGLASIILIFAFPITMGLGYLLLGP